MQFTRVTKKRRERVVTCRLFQTVQRVFVLTRNSQPAERRPVQGIVKTPGVDKSSEIGQKILLVSMMVAIVQTRYFLDSEYCCMFFGQEFQVSFVSQISAVFFSLDFRFYFFRFFVSDFYKCTVLYVEYWYKWSLKFQVFDEVFPSLFIVELFVQTLFVILLAN